MSTSNGSNPSAIAVAAGIGEIEGLLSALLAEARSEVLQVAVSNTQARQMVLEQWPVPGCKRLLAHRTGNGTDGLTVSTAGVLLLSASVSRLGSTWINSGTNAVIIYLSDQKRAGVPAVWLAANGGSWDGRFGNLPWAGDQFAVAQGASTTLVGGEL